MPGPVQGDPHRPLGHLQVVADRPAGDHPGGAGADGTDWRAAAACTRTARSRSPPGCRRTRPVWPGRWPRWATIRATGGRRPQRVVGGDRAARGQAQQHHDGCQEPASSAHTVTLPQGDHPTGEATPDGPDSVRPSPPARRAETVLAQGTGRASSDRITAVDQVVTTQTVGDRLGEESPTDLRQRRRAARSCRAAAVISRVFLATSVIAACAAWSPSTSSPSLVTSTGEARVLAQQHLAEHRPIQAQPVAQVHGLGQPGQHGDHVRVDRQLRQQRRRDRPQCTARLTSGASTASARSSAPGSAPASMATSTLSWPRPGSPERRAPRRDHRRCRPRAAALPRTPARRTRPSRSAAGSSTRAASWSAGTEHPPRQPLRRPASPRGCCTGPRPATVSTARAPAAAERVAAVRRTVPDHQVDPGPGAVRRAIGFPITPSPRNRTGPLTCCVMGGTVARRVDGGNVHFGTGGRP